MKVGEDGGSGESNGVSCGSIEHKMGINANATCVINFDDAEDRGRAALAVDKMLEDLKASYDSYGIKDEPYVMVKSNSGTYGMAVISISSVSGSYRTQNECPCA